MNLHQDFGTFFEKQFKASWDVSPHGWTVKDFSDHATYDPLKCTASCFNEFCSKALSTVTETDILCNMMKIPCQSPSFSFPTKKPPG